MEHSVLIIDNDFHTREALQHALLTEQYKVVCQPSTLAAVTHCVVIKPCAVLLGITMPNMAELAILEGIRLSSPSVPVVIVSGGATADLVRNVLSKGASGVIVKPFSISRVSEVIKSALNSRRGFASKSDGSLAIPNV
jgi:DNA-binding NtrC family response regulator